MGIVIALSGMGISFLIFEKWLKLRLPSGFMLGVGLGLLGLLIFFLGALHLLYPNLIRLMVLLLALPGLYFSASRLRGQRAIGTSSALEIILVSVFGTALILVLVHPTISIDALTYHFSLPRQYLLRNSIAPFPAIAYSHFPQIAEMLYLAGLATAGQITAQMINWLFWLAIILLSREIFSILFDSALKLLSTILLLSLLIFFYLTHFITNDLPAAFFILTGAYLLINEKIELKRRCLLFGLAAGLGCSIKLTLYLYLLLPQSLWLAYLLLKLERKKFFANALIAALGFVIICSPLWIRNIITVGNPLYPALVNLLGGPLSPEQTKAIWNDAYGVHYSWSLLKELFRIPHDALYAPLYRAAPAQAVPFFGTAFSAGLILLLLKRPTRRLIPVFLYCLIFYLAWAFSFRLARFSLGLWIILAILSAGGFSLLFEKGKWLQRIAAFMLTLTILIGLILELLSGARETGWKILLRRESASQYLSRLSQSYSMAITTINSYPAYEWLNLKSGAEDQVILLGPINFFYLKRKALATSIIDWNPLILSFNENKSAGEICRELNRQGIRWLVFQPSELEHVSRIYSANQLNPEGQKRMQEFFQSNCLVPVLRMDLQGVYLYRIVGN